MEEEPSFPVRQIIVVVVAIVLVGLLVGLLSKVLLALWFMVHLLSLPSIYPSTTDVFSNTRPTPARGWLVSLCLGFFYITPNGQELLITST
jgi:hypothetical protein